MSAIPTSSTKTPVPLSKIVGKVVPDFKIPLEVEGIVVLTASVGVGLEIKTSSIGVGVRVGILVGVIVGDTVSLDFGKVGDGDGD